MDRRASVGPPQRAVRAQANLGSMMRGDKFWVPNDADAPPGSVPSTGPEGQPHDERADDDEDSGPTGPTGPNPDANADMLDAAYAADPEGMKATNPSLAYYIGHGDHNPDGSG